MKLNDGVDLLLTLIKFHRHIVVADVSFRLVFMCHSSALLIESRIIIEKKTFSGCLPVSCSKCVWVCLSLCQFSSVQLCCYVIINFLSSSIKWIITFRYECDKREGERMTIDLKWSILWVTHKWSLINSIVTIAIN